MKNAAIPIAIGNGKSAYPGGNTYFQGTPGIVNFGARSWSDASLTVLAIAQASLPFNVTPQPRLGFGDGRADVYVSDGLPSTHVVPPVQLYGGSTFDNLLYSGSFTNSNTAPNQISYSLSTPIAGRLYRVDDRNGIEGGDLEAPFTNVPEAAVLRRRVYKSGPGNPGCLVQDKAFSLGRQLLYMSPVAPNLNTIHIRLVGQNGMPHNDTDVNPENRDSHSAVPAYFRLETESGTVLDEGSLFLYGTNSSKTITLDATPDATGKPPVWRLYTSSIHGPQIELLDGVEEMLLSTTVNDLRAVQCKLPVFVACDQPSSCSTPVCPDPTYPATTPLSKPAWCP